tara:strand:+ start:77 stop:934 length:858 start_codon:yes stop_codon:yes gene_type:complete
MKESPLIIIGMHRSGTTILSKVLEEAGIFFGSKKEKNNEALFFLNINEWIFQQLKASWDFPKPFENDDNEFLNFMTKMCTNRLRSLHRYNFLGFSKFFKYRSIQDQKELWGWKDPRNTFTLKIWKTIFPNAKIIHIYRNPIDVSNSLKVRSKKAEYFYNSDKLINKIKQFFLFGKIFDYWRSIRVADLHEGYKLWEEYVSKSLLEKEALHIKYEDLLQHPHKVLKDIFSFLDLEVDEQRINRFSNSFKKDRIYAFLKNKELVDFYNSIKEDPLLAKLEYNNVAKL